MKYCGVVTDYNWYDAMRKKDQDAIFYHEVRNEEFCVEDRPRIYSDEVPMAGDHKIFEILFGRRI